MRRLPSASLLAAALLGLVLGPATVADASGGPLRSANAAAQRAYHFEDLPSCRVGDALSVVEVSGATPVRLESLSLLYGGAAKPSAQRATFRVVSFRRGTFTGQLGTTFDLSSLDLGTSLGSAAGTVLQPLASSGRWYVVVADVKVVGAHARAWSIKGLGVSYSAGSKSYTELFSQKVDLPATSRCR